MVKCNRSLDKPLQEPFFLPVRFAPHVFPHFVCVIKSACVEKPNAMFIAFQVHGHALSILLASTHDGVTSAMFVREPLGLSFVTPALRLAIDDGVTLARRVFQFGAIHDSYGAARVFD